MNRTRTVVANINSMARVFKNPQGKRQSVTCQIMTNVTNPYGCFHKLEDGALHTYTAAHHDVVHSTKKPKPIKCFNIEM